jgi:streptogramin lyase
VFEVPIRSGERYDQWVIGTQEDLSMRCFSRESVVLALIVSLFSPSAAVSQIGAGPRIGEPVGVAVEASGDLVVIDRASQSVFRVDPTTGDRTLISGASVGAGPLFEGLSSIAVDTGGDLVVVDSSLPAVLRVDSATGDRSAISDAANGIGPALALPNDVAIEASGSLIVTDYSLAALVRIHPMTGDRVIVSDALTGVGPAFGSFLEVAVAASGDLLVSSLMFSAATRHILRVDPVTGDRTVVYGDGIGTGPWWAAPTDLVVDAGGADLLVADSYYVGILTIDSTTGNRAVLSGGSSSTSAGVGPWFGPNVLEGVPPTRLTIALEGSGDLVVADSVLGAVFRVDSLTGERTIVSRWSACSYRAPEVDVACRLADGSSGFGKSSVSLEYGRRKDSLKWNWKKGDAVSTADFKSPDTGTATYRVCIYNNGGYGKFQEIEIEAGGIVATCGTKPCWKASGAKGFKYSNKLGTTTGVVGAKFREGTAGKSKVQIKMGGEFYAAPTDVEALHLGTSVILQLLINDGLTTECFKTTFPAPFKFKEGSFRAKGP